VAQPVKTINKALTATSLINIFTFLKEIPIDDLSACCWAQLIANATSNPQKKRPSAIKSSHPTLYAVVDVSDGNLTNPVGLSLIRI